jgi:gentisate 1,2-dioxygenase
MALDAAGRLTNTEQAERRTLILVNPVEGNNYSITRTTVSAYQMLLPNERARSHRHVPNALRLVLDVEPGAYTTVNGEKLMMAPGDVVLTPGWSWHGHGNEGAASAYWLDFLDVPLVQMLEPMFFEEHPSGFEESVEKTDTTMAFRWADTEGRLASTKDDRFGPFGTQIKLETSFMPTFGLYMMKLQPGVSTGPCKMAANNIYSVVRGCGVTKVGGQRFEWHRGDVVVVPLWEEHSHEASDDAILFRVTDADLMARLGFDHAFMSAAANG